MSENTTRSKVFRGLSSQTLVVTIMGVMEVGVFAVMSRLLAPEDFGYYAVIMAIVNIFQCLTEAGLGSAFIQRNNAPEGFVTTALGLSALFGAIFSILLIALSGPLSMSMGYGRELTESLKWMSITVLLCSVNSVARGIFMKSLDFLKFGWCQIAAYIISSGVGVAMAATGHGINAIIASANINAVLMTIILFWVRGTMPRFKIHRQYTKEILNYGGWLTGSVIVRQITTELDKLILTRWLPVAQIGVYNRPSGFISRIVDRINGIFDTVLFPILSSFKEDRSKLQGSFLTATALVSWFSMILMLTFILGGQIIIDIFFGADWAWLTGIFRVLSLSIIFLAYSRIGDCYFRSLGLVRAYFHIRLAVCAVTLTCVYVGCRYGISGVAVGVLISRIFDSAIKFIYLAAKLSVRWLDLLKAMVAPTWLTMVVAAACFGVVKGVEQGEYIGIFIFIVIGLVLLIFTPKAFGEEYYQNIYTVVMRRLPSRRKEAQELR